MSDTDQNLFSEATGNTLEAFENAPLPAEQPIEQPPSDPRLRGEETPQEPTSSQQRDGDEDVAHVPSGRLREEAEARRRAEREAADLRAQIAAFQVRQQQPQQPQKPVDIFDNPQNFVQQQFQPVVEQLKADMQWRQEQLSRDNAIGRYGDQTVAAAYQALQQGVQMNDPATMNVWQASLNHYDPYGMIVRWHTERSMLREIGSDLDGYKARIVQEAMKDPQFQKQFVEYMRNNSTAQVNQPARSANGQFTQSGQRNSVSAESQLRSGVPYVPSLSDMGTSAPDEQIADASDEALFRAAVSATKRRK